MSSPRNLRNTPASSQEDDRAQRWSWQQIVIRSWLLFAVYIGVGVAVLDTKPITLWLVGPWTRASVAATARVAGAIGVNTRVVGTVVQIGPKSLNVLHGCDGVHEALILVASMLAFPAPWGRRLSGALAGAAAILVLNFVRLVSLILVARYLPARLQLFHIFVWQPLIMVMAFGLFLLWGASVGTERKNQTPHTAA
jgi:exosortase/archaeosortase family protein